MAERASRDVLPVEDGAETAQNYDRGMHPAGSRPHFRLSRWSRLWVPVLVSLVVQLSGAFVQARFAPLVSGVSFSPFVVALVGPAALVLARRFAGPVVLVTAIAAAADLLLFTNSFHPPYIALAFAIVSAIARGARIWAWISVGATWICSVVLAIVLDINPAPPRIAAVTLGVLLVMGVGEGIRTRRERFDEFSRRLAEHRQSEVQLERVRIARELHDVLAHSLSQINVQASVGLHLMSSQPEKAREALASIKDSSKTALDEVRAVLGILRAEGAGPQAPLVPEPDLSRLGGLAASMATQGVAVTVDNSIADRPTAAIQLALFRIVQESLTNVLRHARPVRDASDLTAVVELADVELADDGAGYRVTVRDDGAAVAAAPTPASGGRGLIGMRERAELLGGTLTAGPMPSGGFQVSAFIPRARIPGERS